MKNIRNFTKYLKNGGNKIIVFYFIFNLLVNLINSSVSGRGSSSNTGRIISESTFLTGILVSVVTLVTVAGAIVSFDELLIGKVITFKAFIRNGGKYFFQTLGYGIIYGLLVGVIVSIPLAAYSVLFGQSKNLIGISNDSVVIGIIGGIAIQGFCIPYVVFNVLGKSTKGYIKKNYKFLLVFSIVTAPIPYIPAVGRYIVLLFNCIYYLLILMQHEDYFIKESIITNIS